MPDADPIPGVRAPWLPPVPSVPQLGQGGLLATLEVLLDPVVAVLSIWLLAHWAEGEVRPAWLIASVVVFAIGFPGRRQLRLPPGKVVLRTLLGWFWTAGLLLAMGVATGQIEEYDPAVILHLLWFVPAAQLAAHGALRVAAPHLVRLEGPALRAVVVGMNEQGCLLADRLGSAEGAGIQMVGFFDDRTRERQHGVDRHRCLGSLADIAGYVKKHQIQLIYLSLPMASQPRISQLLNELKDTTASVYFVPDMFVTDIVQGRSDSVCGLPVISVCETPFRGPAGVLKRISDIVLASIILVLISPVMLAVAVAVKLSSPGPVIFRQRRYGLDGREIIVYKFRTMTVTEDGSKVVQARKDDARVTRVGRVLRKTSMDELPQFINVLQGRMSIVGPRPHAVAHNEMYRGLIKSYMVRHKVRPGITGWAQVNGFRGETSSLDLMEARVRCDLDYLRNWSLRLDLYIIWRTIRLVFQDSAAY
jgi:putative colanic acid biosynthesis UDP-glucose lipid carrier transferase